MTLRLKKNDDLYQSQSKWHEKHDMHELSLDLTLFDRKHVSFAKKNVINLWLLLIIMTLQKNEFIDMSMYIHRKSSREEEKRVFQILWDDYYTLFN